MSIADITLSQLGGAAKLKAFVGARDFFKDGERSEKLMFKIKGKKVNYVEIVLEDDDTYSMKFKKIGRMNRKTFEAPKVVLVSEESGVYCDKLVAVFEAATGMYLSL